jgi:hypothetical protein
MIQAPGVFSPGKPFQLSLMFLIEGRATSSEAHFRCSL